MREKIRLGTELCFTGWEHISLIPEYAARFAEQLGRVASIQSEHVVKVLDFGATAPDAPAPDVYWVRDWLTGEDMQSSHPASEVAMLAQLAFHLLCGARYWRLGEEATLTDRIMEIYQLPAPSAALRAAELGVRLPRGFDEWFARAMHADRTARFADGQSAAAALVEHLKR